MRKAALTTFIVVIVSACTRSGASDPIVSEPVRYLEVNLTEVGPDLGSSAVDYVLASGELDLSDQDGYQVLAVASGPDGLRHARLQQLHAGVPVLGSEIVVHADDTTFLGYNGTVTRGLDGFDTTPALGEEDALAIAAADRGAGITFDRQQSRLVVLPRAEQEGADLVWEIELFNEEQVAARPGRWWYFVAADGGAVLYAFDGLTTFEQASGPGGNARVGRTWTEALDVEKDGDKYAMKTSRQETRDMKTQMSGGETAKAAALDGFMDPNVNDAHGFTEISLDMMRDWAGTNSIDNKGFVIIARVHYGKNVDVASWDGQHTNYGDSDPMMRYPRPGALDIVAHEINHGYTENFSKLVYAEQAGGLNESFSDIAGTMAEFYREGDGADLNIGEDIYIAADGMHRSMCMPASKGQLNHLSQFKAGTGVHTSSGIGNKAFCLTVGRFKARTDSSTTDAVRRAGLAWYAANAAFWTSSTDFTQACQGVVDGAKSLGYSGEEVTEITQSWADVGVNCNTSSGGNNNQNGGGGGPKDACDQDDRCEADAGETCSSCSSDCDACAQDCGRFELAKCELGIGDCSACDQTAGCGDGVCAADEDDASCGQDCGCAAPGDTCGSVAPYGCWCDSTCTERQDCCADVGTCGG